MASERETVELKRRFRVRTLRHVIVADGDPAIGRLLRRKLPRQGFDVEVGCSGAMVMSQLAADPSDAVVIGSDLSDISALDLVRALQTCSSVPILVLLSNPVEATVIDAFDAGAHDCMDKPFLIAELAARLRKLVRQTLIRHGIPVVIRSEALEIDCIRWQIRRDGVDVILNAREQSILRMLIEETGNVVSTRAILHDLWDTQDLTRAGRVRNLVKRLRGKLGLSTASILRFQVEPRVGYRLQVPSARLIDKSVDDCRYEHE